MARKKGVPQNKSKIDLGFRSSLYKSERNTDELKQRLEAVREEARLAREEAELAQERKNLREARERVKARKRRVREAHNQAIKERIEESYK